MDVQFLLMLLQQTLETENLQHMQSPVGIKTKRKLVI